LPQAVRRCLTLRCPPTRSWAKWRAEPPPANLSVEVSVSTERHPEGDITTVFARDLTARKKIEAHRNVLESQLRESHKMQAVGTMAGGIAHDFNNIISAILGNVNWPKEDAPAESSPALVSLAEIDKAGRRARDLVRQILTFSRNESPKRSPIHLADVVHETVRLLKGGTATHGRTCSWSIRPGHACRCWPTPPRSNRRCSTYAPTPSNQLATDRGTVSIELGHPVTNRCQSRWNAGLGARGNHVRFAVKDTGSGIDPETLQRVFEPFFTTKPVGEGTGLGLAVVHGIMRTHMGTVDVQSTLGNVGSIFTLYFPVAPIDRAGLCH
jgi:two-component system cell cycle sensor histidine kinase/response regulator CckA